MQCTFVRELSSFRVLCTMLFFVHETLLSGFTLARRDLRPTTSLHIIDIIYNQYVVELRIQVY